MKYAELDDKAKQKARDWMLGCIDSSDTDPELEYVIEVAALLGLAINKDDINWDEYSAAFSARWRADRMKLDELPDHCADADVAAMGAALLATMLAYPHAIVDIDHGSNGQSTYPSYMHVTDVLNANDIEDPEQPDSSIIEAAVIVQARAFAQWVAKQINEAWEYAVSDKNLEQNIIANDYDFDEDGSVQ